MFQAEPKADPTGMSVRIMQAASTKVPSRSRVTSWDWLRTLVQPPSSETKRTIVRMRMKVVASCMPLNVG
jgi:UDP-N-acetyl-D-mannosaminuronic acid transferase (WecB/TagA/CpsF family)